MGGGHGADGVGTGGAVDVQDVEAVATGEADVGLGVASPPGQDPGPITGGVLDAVRTRLPRGCLPNWPQPGSIHEQPTLATAAWESLGTGWSPLGWGRG